MYTEIKRIFVHEMSRDDLKDLISTLRGDKEQVDSLAEFFFMLREEFSNEAPWKVSSIKLRLEKMDDWEQLLKGTLHLVNDYSKKKSSELGDLPKLN